MQILRTIAEVRHYRRELRRHPDPPTLGLVPTMGALHEGHLSLIRAAKAGCERVAVSIFVNPLQFAPSEDLAKYPRTFEDDCALLEREGVDVLFAPQPEEMYPAGAETFVDVPHIGSRLDGASRPNHFRGVATVVSKLFNIVQPDRAYFGQKDAAQVAVLRAMVRDLNFDINLVVCPTVRDPDGLALSSRNRYLSLQERSSALAISGVLRDIETEIYRSNPTVDQLRKNLTEQLAVRSNLRIDYVEIVDVTNLTPVSALAPGMLVAVAAWAGTTRLIDNVVIDSLFIDKNVIDPERSRLP
jgi:pantoate--beta-alanine ligase